MVKLLILAAAINFSQIPTGERATPGEDKSETDMLVNREMSDAAVPDDRAPNFIERDRFDDYSLNEKWRLPEFTEDLSGINPANYIASVRLEDLFGFGPQDQGRAVKNGSILIGVRRPSYRLYGQPYIRGNVDLQLGQSLLGIRNNGIVTISYYLKSDDSYSRLSTSLSIVGISYRFIIPFGY